MSGSRWLILAAVVLAACVREEPAPPVAGAGDTLVPPAASPAAQAPISIQHERNFELTGDTVPELVRVTAVGNNYDSLDVRLAIRAADGSALYAARWPSYLYFVYEDRAQLSDAEVLGKVRSHLQRLVHDSSHYDPRTQRQRPPVFQIDRDQIAWSVAERDWRDQHGVADTLELPVEALREIQASNAGTDRVSGLVAELLGQPAFRYYGGGEANYTIAWSPSERRFFTIWSCC